MWLERKGTMILLIIIFNLFKFAKKFFGKGNKDQRPTKILGVYSLPGDWFAIKNKLFSLLLFFRRLQYYVFGKSRYNVAQLEKLQPLSSDKLAFDAVFFHAVSQDGIYVCIGTERRQEAKINGLFYLVLPGYGLLESEKLPKTTLNADPASLLELKNYAAEGISITPVEPMKLWKISFKGKMRLHDNPKKVFNIQFEAEFKSDMPWFLFEVDVPIAVLARAIAREPWSKEYFHSLKSAHQSHYEQMGYLKGSVKVDGKNIPLELDAFRDHSYGFKRDWSLMHRYIYHTFHLVDGTRISVGVISQPCTSSYLEMGYVLHPNGELEALESCDLLLYQHGENGIVPKELCFTFLANDTTYELKIKYELDAVHYKGNDTEAKMHERFFSCEVNGIPGRGISEWHYNNIAK